MTKIEFIRSLDIQKIYQDFYGGDIIDGNIVCPFHDDHSPSLHFYKDHFHCFSCKKTGSAIDLLLQLKYHGDALKTRDVINEICDHYGYSAEDRPKEVTVKSIFNKEAYEAKIKYSSDLEKINNIFVECLKLKEDNDNLFIKRGISPLVIYRYSLGYCPENIPEKYGSGELKFNTEKDLSSYQLSGLCNSEGTCLYKDRYMIPQHDPWGHIEGYLGRKENPGEKEPKYKSSLNNDFYTCAKSLYNWHVAKNYESIFITEGCFDALSLITLGFKNVVALKGCELHDQQWDKIKDKTLYLCLDNDEAGKRGTYQIIKSHKEKAFIVCCFTDDKSYKDINQLLINEKDKVVDYLNNQTDGVSFAIDYIKNHYSTEAGWEQLAFIIGSDDPAYREKYPINILYNPIRIKKYWEKFYKNN